jgi:hypothetical protein
MTMLSIIANAYRELFPGATVPSVVTASTDSNVLLLYRLANVGGKALVKRHNWAALTTEKTFTTTAAAAQVASVATDFDRILPETIFNRTTKRRVNGPISAEQWQHIQASLTTMVNPSFRIRGSGTASLLITPTPANTTDTIAYEYISKNWAQATGGGATKAAFDTDTDISRFDDEHLHELDIVWRFKAEKGMDYSEELRAFESFLVTMQMNDGAKPRINLSDQVSDRMPYPPQVPDTLVFT